MIAIEDYFACAIPALALLVSVIVAYSNTRQRSISLANKYSEYVSGVHISREAHEQGAPFDQILLHEARLARNYYVWRSFSRLGSDKRSYFNYASFLVYVSGWIGMSIEPASSSISANGSLSLVYPVGLISIVLAVALMVYTRYESTLYGKYLELRSSGKYQPSNAAVFQVKEKVIDESILPVAGGFFSCLILGHYLEPSILKLLLIAGIFIVVIGNSVEPFLRTKSKVKSCREKEDGS